MEDTTVKLRPLAAGAVLAAVALFGSACGSEDPATPNDPAGSSGAEQPGDTSARDELKAALEKSAQQTSMKMTISIADGKIDAHIDAAAKTARMTMDMSASGQKMEIEMITIDTDTYVKYVSGGMAEVAKGKWVHVDAASVGLDQLFSDSFFDPEAMLKEDVTVTKVAEGQYKAEMGAGAGPDLGGLFGGITGGGEEPDPGASAGPSTTVVTVGADGLVSGFSAEAAGTVEKTEIVFTDYGAPLEVQKPADKDIVEG